METTTRPDAVAGSYQSAVADEVLCVDLAVRGALPKELTGTYVRNGANPRPGSEPAHVFLGDGMLHGLRLENGRARWYRNRWVRTNSFVHVTP
jgi:carotenoid cleavage dioxygenase-like enzyme